MKAFVNLNLRGGRVIKVNRQAKTTGLSILLFNVFHSLASAYLNFFRYGKIGKIRCSLAKREI